MKCDPSEGGCASLEKVDAFLNSKVAISALRVLIEKDMPLPISKLAKEIGSNYVTVRKHMNILEQAYFVTSVEYGKRTLYKANLDNPRVKRFKAFIENW